MTPTATPDPRLKLIYESAEQRYLRSLPLEHFMEATPQATQRAITLASFALVRGLRPDVQCFNELLVQYPRDNDPDRPGQVVPDNFVVVHPQPIQADGSYNLPLQPVGPFLVLEYVSKSSARKDYEGNMLKYERIGVPYYLLFYPDNDELSLFRLNSGRYTSVLPNPAGRLTIPELELEVGWLGGWARFWFRGELLPLPAELMRQRDDAQREQELAQRALEAERAARLAAEAEIARLRDELAKARPAS